MTDWESRYQVRDTPWEKGRAAPPLLELLGKLDVKEWGDGPILVPGCGLGHDVRALAKLGVMVVGVDISPSAVEQAEMVPRVGNESYELGDFLDPGWSSGGKFSAIWEHTCFCAIAPSDRGKYARSAAESLTDEGLLAGVFFLTPFDPGDEAPGPPFGSTIEEIEAFLLPSFQKIEGWVPLAAYPGREGKEWIGLFRKSIRA